MPEIHAEFETSEELSQAIQPARHLFDLAGVLFVALHRSGRIAMLNGRMAELLGYPEEALLGRDWFEVAIPAEHRAALAATFAHLMSGNLDPAEYFENDLQDRSGRLHRVAFHNDILRSPSGGVLGTLSLGRDITEEIHQVETLRNARDALEIRVQQRTHALQQANEVLRLEIERRKAAESAREVYVRLFQNAQMGLLVLRAGPKRAESSGIEFLIEAANPVANLLLLAKPPQGGGPILPCASHILPPEALEAAHMTLTRGEPSSVEELRNPRVADPDAVGAWIAVEAFPLGTVRVGLCCRDISPRRRLDEERRRHEEALARSNAELEQFAFVAAHDLQEPLRKILAFGERLLSRAKSANLDAEAEDYLRRMGSAATRMQTLTNDLLAYSRVTTRGQPFESTDLGEILQGVLVDLETRLQESGATLQVDPLPTLPVDPLQMRQLFQNLLGNALKYRKPGRPLVIHVRAEPLADPDRPRAWRLHFEDNGIGFEESQAPRIFEPFVRLHARSAYEGTGFGLAICNKIVRRHLGELSVRSRPGIGSVFSVTLPCSRDPEGQAS